MYPWKPTVCQLPYCCSVQVMNAPSKLGEYDRNEMTYPNLPITEEDLVAGLEGIKKQFYTQHCVLFCVSAKQLAEGKVTHEIYVKHGFKLIHKCKSNSYGGGVLYFYAMNIDGEPKDPHELPVEKCEPDKVARAI